MKKFYLLLLLINTLTFSQSHSNVPLYGFVGGFNQTGVDSAHNPSKKRNSFYVGALMRIPLNDSEKFYLQPQLEYFEAGETGTKDNQYSKKSIYSNNYLSIPLFFKYYFSTNESSIFTFAGPRFAYLINNKVKYPSQERYEKDKDGKVKSIDFSISGGIGYKFNKNFELVSRADVGLIDIYPRIDDSYFDSSAKKLNRQVSVSLGISYIIPNYSCRCY